jgi:predicted nucleic-acid-binding protein
LIALDTNVLVRYIVEDHPEQARQAREAIEDAETIFISHLVLAELSWVLESCYDVSHRKIGDILQDLIDSKQVRIRDASSIREAIRHYEEKSADFSDCLILEQSRSQGCSTLMTFDEKLLNDGDTTRPAEPRS